METSPDPPLFPILPLSGKREFLSSTRILSGRVRRRGRGEGRGRVGDRAWGSSLDPTPEEAAGIREVPRVRCPVDL